MTDSCLPTGGLCSSPPPVASLTTHALPLPPHPNPQPQTYEFAPDDRSLLVMPLFHVHGLMVRLLGLPAIQYSCSAGQQYQVDAVTNAAPAAVLCIA